MPFNGAMNMPARPMPSSFNAPAAPQSSLTGNLGMAPPAPAVGPISALGQAQAQNLGGVPGNGPALQVGPGMLSAENLNRTFGQNTIPTAAPGMTPSNPSFYGR